MTTDKSYIEATSLGVKFYIDKLVASSDTNGVYFASIFGGAEAVKAALAVLVCDGIWNTADKQYKMHCGSGEYTYKTIKLSGTNVAHGIIYKPLFFDVQHNKTSRVIIYGDSKEQIARDVYRYLRKISSVPLLDSWRNTVLRRKVQISGCQTFGIGYAFYFILPRDDELEEFVMKNLQELKELEERSWKQQQELAMAKMEQHQVLA